jgi:hypothetical protein
MPKLSYFRHDDANSIDTWAPDFLCAMLHRTPARHSLEALDLRRLTLLERIDALGYDMEDEDMRSTLLEEMEEAPGSMESGFIPWSQGFENLKSCWLNRKYWMHNGEVYKDKTDQAAKFRPPKCVDWRLTEGGESYRDALGGSYLRL